MLKRLLMFSAVLVLSVGLFTGCGDSHVLGGDPLKDVASAKKIPEIVKEKVGSPAMIFQYIHIGEDKMIFSRQDQKKLENVDGYLWTKDTGWKGPNPTTLKGGGNLADNLFNLEDVNWEAMPVFVSAIEKRATEEGLEKVKIDTVSVYLDVEEGILSYTADIKAERKEAYAKGDVKTGEITYFNVR